MLKLGCVNVYGLILLKYCGVVFIQWFIYYGEVEIGNIMMLMDVGMDIGLMFLKSIIFIGLLDNVVFIVEILVKDGVDLLLEILLRLEDKEIEFIF